MEIKELTHTMWDIRHDYLEKMHNVVLEVYNNLGGFVAGTDLKGNSRYFLLVQDWVKFSFNTSGYFDIFTDPLELDCYGELRKVDYKEFKEAFEKTSDTILKLHYEEKLRDTIWKDIGVAHHLIKDEMFRQMRRDYK